MLYAIITEDAPNSLEKRLAVRPRHFPRVEQLANEGRLICGGAFPAIDSNDPGPAGFTGSLIVAEFPSLEEAEAWAKQDPFYTEGVYAKVTVKPYRKALPK
jgi:uncharacterized protein